MIGAVVVGEDAGSTSNFVYVTSSNVSREGYDKANDEYTWTRVVALDGEEIEIAYVDSEIDEIDKDSMEQGKWYYVRYYADGTVKDTDEVPASTVVGSPYHSYNVVTGDNSSTHGILDAVERIEDDLEHVLLNNSRENGLTFRNGTLYSSYSDEEGIWISPNVKVVRQQSVDGKDFAETEYYDGRDGLEDALEDMVVDANDDIYVSAIIEDGAAMVVVLNNMNDEITDEGKQEVDEDIMVDLSTRNDVQVTYIGTDDPGLDAMLDAIAAKIESTTDYEVTEIAEDPDNVNNWIFTAVNGIRTRTYTFIDDGTNDYRVAKVNWEFSHVDKDWSFTSDDEYVKYTGGDTLTGTLTYAGIYNSTAQIGTISATGGISVTGDTDTFTGVAGESKTITFTVTGTCTADEVTITLNGVTA